jgi:hypothetical protein
MNMSALTATTGAFSGGTLSVSGGTPTLQIIDQIGQNPRIVFMGQTSPWFWIDSPSGNFLRISNGGVPGYGAVSFYADGSVSMGALTATTGTFSANGTTSIYAQNSALNSSSTSGTTGIFIGDASSGINVITREKVTSNTTNTCFYSEYGYSAAVKALTLYNGSATFASSVSMGALTATTGTFSGSVSQTPVAFASLPAGSAGMRAFVNNNSAGAAFGSAANGSGSTTYPVYHDGVSWKIG